MTAVRPDDTAGTGERGWFHEYGFEGVEDFEEIVDFAVEFGFTFVYGGCTRDAAWVGYPAECDRLLAAVREAEARAERAERALRAKEILSDEVPDDDVAAYFARLYEGRAAVSGEAPNEYEPTAEEWNDAQGGSGEGTE